MYFLHDATFVYQIFCFLFFFLHGVYRVRSVLVSPAIRRVRILVIA